MHASELVEAIARVVKPVSQVLHSGFRFSKDLPPTLYRPILHAMQLPPP